MPTRAHGPLEQTVHRHAESTVRRIGAFLAFAAGADWLAPCSSAASALRTGRVALVVIPSDSGQVTYRYDDTNPDGRAAVAADGGVAGDSQLAIGLDVERRFLTRALPITGLISYLRGPRNSRQTRARSDSLLDKNGEAGRLGMLICTTEAHARPARRPSAGPISTPASSGGMSSPRPPCTG